MLVLLQDTLSFCGIRKHSKMFEEFFHEAALAWSIAKVSIWYTLKVLWMFSEVIVAIILSGIGGWELLKILTKKTD